MNNIEIYSSPTCTYCMKAKKLLKMLGLEYTEHDVSNSFDEMSDKLKKEFNLTDVSTIPQIIINGYYVGGYDDLESLYKSGKIKDILK